MREGEKRRGKVERDTFNLLNDVRDARARCERAVRVTSYGWLVEDEMTDRRDVSRAGSERVAREGTRESSVE